MIAYDFDTTHSSAFDIGLKVKHEQNTKQPHRVKDLPGSTTPCKIVFI